MVYMKSPFLHSLLVDVIVELPVPDPLVAPSAAAALGLNRE